MKDTKKAPRRKLYVAYVRGEVVGMSNGFTDEEAQRIFATERKLPLSAVVVKWTGKKEVSFAEFNLACEKQVAFFAA